MFEKFTSGARMAIFFYLRYEADISRAQYIEPKHLLLAILDVNETPYFTESVFKNRLTYKHVSKYFETPEPELWREKVVDLAFSAETKKIIASAGNYASAKNQNTIGPVHFLYGMIQDTNSLLFKIISEAGITLEEIEQEAANIQSPEVTA